MKSITRYLILSLSFLFVPFAHAAQNEVRLELIFKKRDRNPIIRYWLSSEEGKLYCRAEKSDKRVIKVHGLKSINPPFKGEKKTAAVCSTLIRWGSEQSCYKKFEQPILDRVLEQCASM